MRRADADAWLAALPRELGAHGDALRHLIEAARGDERVRLVVVGCSIGRGAADELSDVDAYLGVRAASWPAFADDVPVVIRTLGDVLDTRSEMFEARGASGGSYQHTFVQYRNGLQLDLVVAPAAARAPGHDWVVLYDPDGLVGGPPASTATTPDQVRGWMFNAFVRLGYCAKYLSRGSLWEASEMLHNARGDLWRLWATARSLPDPQYGLTAVLDGTPVALPSGIEATVARMERRAIALSALACADLLVSTWPAAITAAGDGPTAVPSLAQYVRERLLALVH